MRAENNVRRKLLQVADDARPRTAGKGELEFVHAPRGFGAVGLFENLAPQFRRAFDELHVTVQMNFFMER